MQRSVATDPSDRRFRPLDALARLVAVLVGIAALTGPFRRTIYLTPADLNSWSTYTYWRVSETSIAMEQGFHHLSNRVATNGNVVEVTTTPGGALLEYQHFGSSEVVQMAVTDAVAAATAPPVPVILAVATVLAVLTTALRRRA